MWGLQEPQPVPARVASHTFPRLRCPAFTAPMIFPFETPLQLHI